MTNETYATPEGFELYRPLIFPDARDFGELFEDVFPWNYATMNHRNGYPQPATPKDIEREGFERVVSHFCATRNLPKGRSLHVTPRATLLDRIFSDSNDFAFFDRVSFEAIYHEKNNRVLITAQASGIIASRWLAYVDPTTVPVFKD